MISRRVYLLFISLLFVCMILLLSVLPDNFDSFYLALILIISTILFSSPFIVEEIHSIKSNIIRPSIIFLLGYFIVFFQRYYDLFWGFTDIYDSIFVSPTLINYSLLASTMGLSMFFLGYYSCKGKAVLSQKDTLIKYNIRPIKILYVVATLLFVIFQSKDLLSGNYSQETIETNAGGMSNYSSILMVVVYFALLTICVYNCKICKKTRLKDFVRSFGLVGFICTFIYLVLLLIGGSRSNVITVIISMSFSCLYIKGIRIKFIYVFLGVVMFAYMMSFIGVTRESKEVSLSEKVRMYEVVSFNKKSIIPTTLELAGSLETFNYSIEYVPQKHDYLYGSFFIRNIVSAIPFSGRFSGYLFNTEKRYHSSDYFVTYIIQGDSYTYGNGTSINADLYLNFGLIGIVIGLFLLGRFFRKIEYAIFCSTEQNIVVLSVFLYIIGYAALYSRFGFLSPINYIAFICLLLYIYKRCGLYVCKSK